MSESLKQKAKEVFLGKDENGENIHKWMISLEDAEAELKEKSEGYAKVVARLSEERYELHKLLEEQKKKLQEWYVDLGRWLMSSEVRGKLEGWNKLELPSELKERFEELLKNAL